jgi:hypothetical protein
MSDNSQKIIFHDSKFGKLSYHKNFESKFQWPSNEWLCWMPFEYAEIRTNGTVNICCPQWNPVIIGNVLDENFDAIWTGDIANEIRNTIFDGSYSYCNSETCFNIQGYKSGTLLRPNTEQWRDKLTDSVKRTPSKVLFCVDRSCNLSCPSCRTSKQIQILGQDRKNALRSVKTVLHSMFPEPHSELKLIGMDGTGEVFSSDVYREIFETEEIFTHTYKWPNLKFNINTNGTMMTEKYQKKHSGIFNNLSMLELSIDAGNKESYEKVRVGGDWNTLWKNLFYFYKNNKHNPSVQWQWNLIIQQNNFQSIPEFVNIANMFSEKLPRLKIVKMLNWGTFSEERYLEQAVWMPSHPMYLEYINIMNLPHVKQYSNIISRNPEI